MILSAKKWQTKNLFLIKKFSTKWIAWVKEERERESVAKKETQLFSSSTVVTRKEEEDGEKASVNQISYKLLIEEKTTTTFSRVKEMSDEQVFGKVDQGVKAPESEYIAPLDGSCLKRV